MDKKKRSIQTDKVLWKSIIKTNYLVKIDCHNHHNNVNNTRIIKLNFNNNLKLNHYQIISKEYWYNIRCIRGGGVHGPNIGSYKKELFNDLNNSYTNVYDKNLKIKKELKDWWKIYNLNYNLNINNYKDAYIHWCNNKNINKTHKFSDNDFNWRKYINNYKDLKERLNYNKESAWKHYLNYGIKENRNYI